MADRYEDIAERILSEIHGVERPEPGASSPDPATGELPPLRGVPEPVVTVAEPGWMERHL